jgi:hypothetical protein
MDPDFSFYSRRFRMTGSLDNVYETLAGLDSPELRFAYARDLLKVHGMLPTELMRPGKELMIKREMTDKLLRIGHEHFHGRDFVLALKTYTKCVKYTEPGTVQHAYALAYRSAVYYHLWKLPLEVR